LVLAGSLLLNLVLVATIGTQFTGGGRLREELVTGDPLTPEKVALVSLKGIIMDSPGGSFGSGTFRFTLQQLEQVARDEAVKAIVLEVDSPGGGVTASDILCRKVRQLRAETGKPVVVSMGSVAASGGYYVSVAADRILAQPTTVTGSIGVLMSLINAEGLMEKIGVRSVVLKSAEHKDLGSPFREMTPEERSLLQGVVEHLFARFKEVVADGRGLSPAKVDILANGRIFTAEEALASGLIDRIGYLEDAIAEAKQMAGVPEAKVVCYQRPSGLISLLMGHLQGPGASRTLTVNVTGLPKPFTPRFLYMWLLGGEMITGSQP